jgi:hypothetical protein
MVGEFSKYYIVYIGVMLLLNIAYELLEAKMIISILITGAIFSFLVVIVSKKLNKK